MAEAIRNDSVFINSAFEIGDQSSVPKARSLRPEARLMY